MKKLYADFNYQTSDGRYALNTLGSLDSIEACEPLTEGERVILSDGDIEVEAILSIYTAATGLAPKNTWMATPDPRTWRDL